MSQPTNRNAIIPRPGKLDGSLKEFWAENPWQIITEGNNLSSFERNRLFINRNGKGFLEASHLSGADSDGDGRSAVAADLFNTGRMDLVVRQSGGGALLLYENQLPARSSLRITLRGATSNRQGIGARLVAEVAGRRIVRENYPANSYFSQAPAIVHLGLGDARQIDKLTIHWPSGKTQVMANLPAGGHIAIDEAGEGLAAVKPLAP